MGRSAADTVMGGSAAGGPQVVQHLYGDSSVAQPVWLCSCSQITAPIIPTCPSMVGVVVCNSCRATLTGDPAVEFAYVNVNGGHTRHMMEACMGAAGFLLLVCLHRLYPPP